ncbi:MAG: hypothetical protein ACTHLW_04870 [Verrucomicrobiota bacterium]
MKFSDESPVFIKKKEYKNRKSGQCRITERIQPCCDLISLRVSELSGDGKKCRRQTDGQME